MVTLIGGLTLVGFTLYGVIKFVQFLERKEKDSIKKD